MDPATLLCERCGYVVEGLDERGACPECGKPIAESVPERRTGVPIEPDADGKVNWWRAAWAVLWKPGETFERVRIDATIPLRFAGVSVVGVAVISGAAVCLSVSHGLGRSYPGSARFFDPEIAGYSVVVVVAVAVLVSVLICVEMIGLSIIARGHGYRSTSEVRCTIVGYASIGWFVGMLVPVFVLLTPVLVELIKGRDVVVGPLITVSRTPPYEAWEEGAQWLALVTLIVPLFLFELLCYIGIRRCKFANQPRIRSAEPGAGGSTNVPPASE